MAEKKSLHTRRRALKLRKFENRYLSADAKRESALKKLDKPPTKLQKLTIPYGIHYYNTRSADSETGKVTYKRSLRIEEQTRKPYIQRGVLHKIDYIAKNHIHSDKAPHISNPVIRKAAGTAYKTALAAETGAIAASDKIKAETENTLLNKLRQEAQDDASQGAVKVGGTALSAAVGTLSHLNQKRKNAPYLKAEKKLRKKEAKTEKINRKNKKSKTKAFGKLKKLDKIYYSNRGRHLKAFTNLQTIRKQEKLTAKSLEKKNNKHDKLKKKQRKVNDRLYKLRNKSLASKGASASVMKVSNAARSKAFRDAGENNDSLKAVDAIVSAASKHKGNPQKRYSRKLKKYSKKEQKLHKKSAGERFRKQNSKFSRNNNHMPKKAPSIKKEGKTILSIIRPGSKFGIAVILLILPMLIIPMLFSSCVGLFANEGTFRFVTSYYGAMDSDLSDAAAYYQKLAHELNRFVLSVPTQWKNHLSELNIPADYKDDPTKFVFGNNNRLPSDTAYDYDRHKLYAFLCAYLYVPNENGSIQKWTFNDSVKDVLDKLFDYQYQFRAKYENSSHWLLLSEYTDVSPGRYYSASKFGALIWNDENGEFACARGYLDGIGCSYVSEFLDSNGRLYYDLNNGEILNANNNFSATGWYLQKQSVNTVDGSGNRFEGWYEYDSDSELYIYTDKNGNTCRKNYYGYLSYNINDESVENEYVIPPLDWYNYKYPEYNYYNKLYAGTSRTDVEAEMQTNGHTNSYVRILKKYERINECTLYYTVNRKCTFDKAIYKILMSLEDGEERYAYYRLLHPYSSCYYGMHQTGCSPVSYGYRALPEKGYIVHSYSYEMKYWNKVHCRFCNENIQHSGVNIIQNSGSDVYAMVSGEISKVGSSWFVLKGYTSDRNNRLPLYIIYCNVKTDYLRTGQEVQAGDIISETTSDRCEIEYDYTYNGSVALTRNDIGSNYLSITVYIEEKPLFPPTLIDPELIMGLSDNTQ